MGSHMLLLLLLLLGLAGQGLAGSYPEVLQAHVGSSILVQCHYQPQDGPARKVWCRFLSERCQTLVSSAVDRGAQGGRRVFLTDLGGGLLQVEMVSLREEDAGEYGCMMEGAAGTQTLHRISLEVIPAVSHLREEEEDEEEEEEAMEETFRVGSEADGSSSDSVGSVSPSEPRGHKKSILLICGAVVLLGLLLVAVVLFAVMAKRRGSRLGVCGQVQSSQVSSMAPSTEIHHISNSGLVVDLPSDVPYVRLDSPPSFDNTTYTSLPLDPPSGKSAPALPLSPPVPPEVPVCSSSVTYATVIFPGEAKGRGLPCDPVQDPLASQTPPS